MLKTTVLLMWIFLWSLPSCFAQQKESPRPNIIFILVDDQGYGDLGVFYQNQRAKAGLPHERSPFLDQMASEGAMLTQHYSAAPVCAPSRASLMLGVSQGHANVRDNQFDKALADNYTMASALRQLGYQTAAIGKWGLQGSAKWDKNGAEWPARPAHRGFDYFLGYMRHGDGHEHYPKEGLYSGNKEVWFNGKMITDQLDKCYTADLWTAAAKHWIVQHQQGADKNQPFFMYLAYDTPHAVDELPTQAYPKGGGLHGGIQWIGQAGHFINTASGTPDSYFNPDYAHATYDDDHQAATPEVPWPDTYKRYATANRRIDYAVGDLLQLLRDLKIDSNTLVIYSSDNGPSIETYLGKDQAYEADHLPTFFGSYGPFDGIKRDNWEGGVRMPTLARWPGHIPAGSVMTEPSINYDWAPTFITAAGATPPERMDGRSLLAALLGTGHRQDGPIYVEYFHGGKTPTFKDFAPTHRGRRRKQMQNIRIGDYVGVRYNIQSAADSFEIYNVVRDPQQTHNLAGAKGKKVRIPEISEFFASDTGRQQESIGDLQQYMKARVLQVRRPSAGASRPYDSVEVPAVQAQVTPGLHWRFYAGQFPWIPQVKNLAWSAQGTVAQPAAGVLAQNKAGILVYYGYISVPRAGKYTLYLESSGPAFMRLHDMQLIDADHDYTAGVAHKGTVSLQKGLHPFRLYVMQKDASSKVTLEWSGPGINRQSMEGSCFVRNKKL